MALLLQKQGCGFSWTNHSVRRQSRSWHLWAQSTAMRLELLLPIFPFHPVLNRNKATIRLLYTYRFLYIRDVTILLSLSRRCININGPVTTSAIGQLFRKKGVSLRLNSGRVMRASQPASSLELIVPGCLPKLTTYCSWPRDRVTFEQSDSI